MRFEIGLSILAIGSFILFNDEAAVCTAVWTELPIAFPAPLNAPDTCAKRATN